MMRSWWDNEEILRQFHDWLVGTEDEVEAVDGEASTAPDHEGSTPDTANAPAPKLPEAGLLQMVEAFSAMRHEIKLYTKGTRNLEGAVERSLEQLEAASRTFKSVQSKEQEAVDYAALPMVEALIELHESFLRAGPVLKAAHEQLTRAAPARLCQQLDEQLDSQPWWRRWMVRRWHERMRYMVHMAQVQTAERELAVFMEGFQMIQSRLARALAGSNIQRVDETGVPTDPTRMTVVELLTDSHLPPETVVEVVRPGYLWGSRVVRYAEVRAVASRKTGGNDTPTLKRTISMTRRNRG
ncbi:MAG: nucleotide exchange factor GrpE, partial [Planctomycetota bacterium]